MFFNNLEIAKKNDGYSTRQEGDCLTGRLKQFGRPIKQFWLNFVGKAHATYFYIERK
nr:MAG TPA: hypothetical protein [Caudoviricetes sp.]